MCTSKTTVKACLKFSVSKIALMFNQKRDGHVFRLTFVRPLFKLIEKIITIIILTGKGMYAYQLKHAIIKFYYHSYW